ncbi:hypothetical protein Q5H92_12490 [Hymenobacter sp. M29]|uniref:Uncharacterized protein n=1 Tax=Hymenobacter mellowenesis TaxID=3063995 RepID=A0ABT9ABF9_9BACT|nr:hypothetical protein [Hymenobacter sp. M29]MDO7847182.1 hypothetical protein [Hymenobacter sp. M29]
MKTALLLLLTAAAGCHSTRPAAPPTAAPAAQPAGASAPALLYKTRADYHDRVPVLLSADGRSIVSYPAPSDVSGHLPQPTALADGYWLDNRGIGPHVAFLKLTYADYAQLTAAPTLAELETLILDRDPLTALCDCGPRTAYANPATDLNALIVAGRLPTRCKVLK